MKSTKLYYRKLPIHVSPFPVQGMVAVHAPPVCRDHMKNHTFPLITISEKVIKIREQSVNCKTILIAPYWPTNLGVQYSDLLQRAIQDLVHRNLDVLNLNLETIQRIGPPSKMVLTEQFFHGKSQFFRVTIFKFPGLI